LRAIANRTRMILFIRKVQILPVLHKGPQTFITNDLKEYENWVDIPPGSPLQTIIRFTAL
jgi:hypothetical protein